ncbi:hypothetical protein PGTUg99_019872 [Puccinia graminis f. sp. tritici]|uniref:Uncharacterized protein n=1 Tax=Puccinia graminis f. sp. tritici TaxID=56615 RepID=A0A5B0NS48_PUCGR|nr:hypothetical protein PGTUg99_019872 [Puccinia graminis f. sp. tritici]
MIVVHPSKRQATEFKTVGDHQNQPGAQPIALLGYIEVRSMSAGYLLRLALPSTHRIALAGAQPIALVGYIFTEKKINHGQVMSA